MSTSTPRMLPGLIPGGAPNVLPPWASATPPTLPPLKASSSATGSIPLTPTMFPSFLPPIVALQDLPVKHSIQNEMSVSNSDVIAGKSDSGSPNALVLFRSSTWLATATQLKSSRISQSAPDGASPSNPLLSRSTSPSGTKWNAPTLSTNFSGDNGPPQARRAKDSQSTSDSETLASETSSSQDTLVPTSSQSSSSSTDAAAPFITIDTKVSTRRARLRAIPKGKDIVIESEEDEIEEDDDISERGASQASRLSEGPLKRARTRVRGRQVPVLNIEETSESKVGEGIIDYSNGKPRSYVCTMDLDGQTCGKCFRRAEHLKRHVTSIHKGEKPFQCLFEGCGRYFSRRDNLTQHMGVHRKTYVAATPGIPSTSTTTTSHPIATNVAPEREPGHVKMEYESELEPEEEDPV